MATFPLVKGTRLRASRINSCGLPIAGPGNRLVTGGFVTVGITAQMKDANDIEQTNAEGKVCVSDRTPPERKFYNISLELCDVNTGLISMFTGWEQVLGYGVDPIGFRDQRDVDDQYGVALEVWTGGRADDCPLPDADSIFDDPGTGLSYGYLLFGTTEYQLGDINVQADVSTLTLSGITIAMPQWGRGPYNVIKDSTGAPARLADPLNDKSHLTALKTEVAPPDATPGSEPVELAISSVFTGGASYFGADSTDSAPAQPVAS